MASVVSNDIKASGGDYADIAAWEAATDIDIVGADEQHDGLLYDEVYAELVDIEGATTDATRYRHLTAAPGETPDDGTWVAGDGPRLRPTGLSAGDILVRIHNEDYARVSNFEIGPTTDATGSGTSVGVKCGSGPGQHVTGMLIHDINTSANQHGIAFGNSCIVARNIVYNIAGSSSRGFAGWDNNSVTGYLVNNTAHNCQEGFRAAGSSAYTTVVKNNLGTGNSGEDFNEVGSSTRIADYNVSDDATGDDMGGSNNTINVTPANEYVSLTGGSEDLHLKSGASAIGAGVDLATTPEHVNIDIDGYDVDGGGDAAWDAGADQYNKANSSPGVSGSATIVVPVAVVAADGTVKIQGSASLVVPVPQVTAAGHMSAAGSASLVVPVPQVTGSGKVQVQGSASLVVPVPQVIAAGHMSAAGAAVVVVPVPVVVATGVLGLAAISGSAVVVVPVPVVASTGKVITKGVAGLTVPVPVVTAAGEVQVQGAAVIVVPVAQVTGAGHTSSAGGAVLVVPVPQVSADGTVAQPANTGSAVIVVPVPQVFSAVTDDNVGGHKRRRKPSIDEFPLHKQPVIPASKRGIPEEVNPEQVEASTLASEVSEKVPTKSYTPAQPRPAQARSQPELPTETYVLAMDSEEEEMAIAVAILRLFR